MVKSDWEEVLTKLRSINEKLHSANFDYLHGKNKAIRKQGETTLDHLIFQFDHIVKSNYEIYKLATGGEIGSDFSRAITYDEFLSKQYFSRDLPRFIRTLEEHIESLH